MYWHRSNAEILKKVKTECHTVDYAYTLLSFMKNERDDYISYTLAQNKRTLAEVIQADEIFKDEKDTRQHRVLAEYHLDEAKALHPSNQKRLDYARQESKFIQILLEKLDSHRLYKDLDTIQSEQLSTRDNMIAQIVWDSYIDLCAMNIVTSDRYVQARGFDCYSEIIKNIDKLRVMHSEVPPGEFLILSKTKVLTNVPSLKGKLMNEDILPLYPKLLGGYGA